MIHKLINFSRRPDSPDTLADPHLEELTITAKLGNADLIITNVYIPPASGIQVLQIREALCSRAWCLALILVF